MRATALRLTLITTFSIALIALAFISRDSAFTATIPNSDNFNPDYEVLYCNDLPAATGMGGGVPTSVIPGGGDNPDGGNCEGIGGEDATPGGHPDTTIKFLLPNDPDCPPPFGTGSKCDDPEDYNFATLATFSPPESTTAEGPGNPAFSGSSDPSLGVPIGSLTSATTLGLINGECTLDLTVTFLFLNGNVDNSSLVPTDNSVSGYPDGVTLPEGTTKRFRFLNDPDPDHTSTITGTADSGTTTGGVSTLTDSAAFGSADSKVGMTVYITGGTGGGQRALVVSNTSDTLTINRRYNVGGTVNTPSFSGSLNATWSINPSSDSDYTLGYPFHTTRTPKWNENIFDQARVSHGDWDGDTLPDTDSGEAAEITTNPLQTLARYTAWTIPPQTGEPIMLQFAVFKKAALAGFKALSPENDTHEFARLGATSFGDASVTLLQDPTAVLLSPSSITDFCSPLGTVTMLLGEPEAGKFRYTNPSALTGLPGSATGWHNHLSYSLSLRDASGNGIESVVDTCKSRFVPRSDAIDFDGGERPNGDAGDALYGWNPKWSSSVTEWMAADAIDGTVRTYSFAKQPWDVDGDGLPNPCDPDPLITSTNEDDPADPTVEYLNRQDFCPSVDDPGGLESELFNDHTSMSPDGGPHTDAMGDPCDGGTQVVETGKVASASDVAGKTILTMATSGIPDGRSWPSNIFRPDLGPSATLKMTSGPLTNETILIAFNNANQLLLEGTLSNTANAVGETFEILRDFDDAVADGFFAFNMVVVSKCVSNDPGSECPGNPVCPNSICADVDGDLFNEAVERDTVHDPVARCAITPEYEAWPPDIDNSNTIDVLDLSTVGGAVFGLSAGQIGYWEKADVDGTGVINMLDLSTVGGTVFGTSCTVGPG